MRHTCPDVCMMHSLLCVCACVPRKEEGEGGGKEEGALNKGERVGERCTEWGRRGNKKLEGRHMGKGG